MANECNDNAKHHVSQELTQDDKIYAEKYLNETDEIRENAIAEIKCWIEKELRIRIDNFLILRFLRICEFNIEETKLRIRNYYKHRSELPEWYKKKDPFLPELQELLDLGAILPLRKPDSQGRLIVLVRSTLHDPKKHKITDILKINAIMAETAVKYYPAVTMYGSVLLIDAVNPSFRQMLQLRPHLLMNLVHSIQNCYPVKFDKFNLFNVPKILEPLIKLTKSFMDEKTRNKIYICSSVFPYSKDIPVEILPVEYGGTDGTCQELIEYWKKQVEENRNWLMHDEEDNRIE